MKLADVKKRLSKSHQKIIDQGKDILFSTQQIDSGTQELKRVTYRIDEGIRNFSEDPERYRRQIQSEMVDLRGLVESLSSVSGTNTEGFEKWLLTVQEDRESFQANVQHIADSVDYFTEKVETYNEAIILLRDYVYGFHCSTYESRREDLKAMLDEIIVDTEVYR